MGKATGRAPVIDVKTGDAVDEAEVREALFELKYIDFEFDNKKFQLELDRMELRADVAMQLESVKGRIFARGKRLENKSGPTTLAEKRAARAANREAYVQHFGEEGEEKPTSVGLQQIDAIADGAEPSVVTGPAGKDDVPKKKAKEEKEASPEQMEAYAEGMPEIFALQLKLFVPAIKWWNVPAPPGQDPALGPYMPLTLDNFQKKEIGQKAIAAIGTWHDDPTKSPEGEGTETTPKANSNDSANSTTQTDGEESENSNSSTMNSQSSTEPVAPQPLEPGLPTTSLEQ